jgi:hypothetical protein
MPDKNQKKAPGQKSKTQKKSGANGNNDPIDATLDAGSGFTNK